jgi:uncharacterized protein RhaS with RHS repeats
MRGASGEQEFYCNYHLPLFFMQVIQLLVQETNKYYNQYTDTQDSDGRCSKLPDMTVQEANIFLA